ncbi:MAG: hypothetical protein ACOYN0_12660, partial [Phycisphaerales bacterium]
MSNDASDNPLSDFNSSTERRVVGVKRRLMREAAAAIHMLEGAIAALFALDPELPGMLKQLVLM